MWDFGKGGLSGVGMPELGAAEGGVWLQCLRENQPGRVNHLTELVGTGRVPQVRLSVPGPKMKCFDCF
jgi:hypothetical protein